MFRPAQQERYVLENFNSIQPVTLREQVFEEIQLAILEGRIKPGDHIREHELTKALNVSRTPVREALVLLERDGLVENLPNRGCFVRQFDDNDIVEIFTMRTSLENLAARLVLDKLNEEHFQYLEGLIQKQAAVYDAGISDKSGTAGMLDLAFHKYLVQLSGNHRLYMIWRAIAMQYTVVFSDKPDSQLLEPGDRHQLAIKSHQEILAALRARNLARVEETNWRTNNQMAEGYIAAYRKQFQQETVL